MLKNKFICTLSVLISFTGIALLGFYLLHFSTMAGHLANSLQQNRSVFMLWRYSLCGFFIVFWPGFVQLIGRWKKWDQSMMIYLGHKRVCIFSLLLMMELVLHISI